MIKMNGYEQFKVIYNKFDGSYGELIEDHHRLLNELENYCKLLKKPIKKIKEI
jgi:hypothetical protein